MTQLAARCSLMLLGLTVATGGCTGLVAGPETSNVTPVPASRDSAYVRARRALQGDNFTLDVTDSTRMSDKAPKVCEQERSQVLERTVAVIVPPNP